MPRSAEALRALLVAFAFAVACRKPEGVRPAPASPAPKTASQVADEVFPGLLVEGRWDTATSHEAAGRSRLWSRDPEARLSFSFDGRRLALYRLVQPGAPTMEVCLDGQCRPVVNAASRDFGVQPVHLSGLTSRPHQVRISRREGAWLDLDRIETRGPARPLGEGHHEDTDPDIAYEGSWLVQRRDGPSGGTVHTAFDIEARMEVHFEGEGIVMFVVRYDDREEVEVCIDGRCSVVNNYAPALLWVQPVLFTGLGPGPHQLVLRRLRGRYLDVDGLEVLGNARPLPPGAHTSREPRIRYFGSWRAQEVAGGERQASASPGAAVYLAFRGTGIVLRRTLDSDRGRSELCVDGSCREVDSYAPEAVPGSPVEISGLAPGVHHL
ncbi:MAG TPA: hypothetical protein VI589_09800, partial [Vicinamibacteria bacterium]